MLYYKNKYHIIFIQNFRDWNKKPKIQNEIFIFFIFSLCFGWQGLATQLGVRADGDSTALLTKISSLVTESERRRVSAERRAKEFEERYLDQAMNGQVLELELAEARKQKKTNNVLLQNMFQNILHVGGFQHAKYSEIFLKRRHCATPFNSKFSQPFFNFPKSFSMKKRHKTGF